MKSLSFCLVAVAITMVTASPASAYCYTTRVCTPEGCYNDTYCPSGSRDREERSRRENNDRRDFNRQRGYPEWDSRGERRERQRSVCRIYGDCQ